MTVTTWHLEQTAPIDLRPAKPSRLLVDVARAEVPLPEFSEFLHRAVGGAYSWNGRREWSREEWLTHLDRPGVETWVATHRGTPAGYVEMVPRDEGEVEILCFGLLPWAIGSGLGGHLLTEGTARAWDLGERWPDLPATIRVRLHTCSLDHPRALANYQARGYRVFKTVDAP